MHPPSPYESLKDRLHLPLLSSFGAPDARLSARVDQLAVSRGGERALALSADAVMVVWDLESGRELAVLDPERSGYPSCATFDGEAVVFLTKGGQVRRWTPGTAALEDLAACGAPKRCVVFSADARRVAMTKEEELEVWDLSTQERIRSWPGADDLSALSFSPDGKKLLATTFDDTLKLFDLGTGSLEEPKVKLGSILGAAMTSASQAAFAVVDVGLVLVDFGPKPKKSVLHKGDSKSYTCSLDVSATGKHLVAGLTDGELRTWSLKAMKPVLEAAHTDDVRGALGKAPLFPALSKIEAVAVSGDGSIALSAVEEVVRFFDAKKGELRFEAAHKSRVCGLSLPGQGKGALVASGGEDGAVVVRERATGKVTRRIELPGRVWALAGAAGGSTVWLGLDGALELWDVVSGKRKKSLSVKCKGAADRVDCLALSDDGARLAMGCRSGQVELRDGQPGEVQVASKSRGEAIRSVALGGPGWILAGDAKGRLLLLDGETGKELAAVPAHPDGVTGVALSADGKRAASASPTALAIWDVDSTHSKPALVSLQVKALEDHCGQRPVQLTPDGARVFVGGRVPVVFEAASGRELDRLDLKGSRDALGTLRLASDPPTLWAGTDRGLVLCFDAASLGAPAALAVEAPPKHVPKGPYVPMASLSGEELKEALAHHFSVWATTPECQALLGQLVSRVHVCETTEGGDLVITFDTDGAALYSATFAQPYRGKAAPGAPLPPKSFWDVVRLHNGVRFDKGVPDELDLSGYDEESGVLCDLPLEDLGGNPGRHLGFCDAGQNWFSFDLKKKNKLGEPMILLARHEAPIAQAAPFPGQEKLAFGIGGFLLRALAHRVLAKDPAYSGCGWG